MGTKRKIVKIDKVDFKTNTRAKWIEYVEAANDLESGDCFIITCPANVKQSTFYQRIHSAFHLHAELLTNHQKKTIIRKRKTKDGNVAICCEDRR